MSLMHASTSPAMHLAPQLSALQQLFPLQQAAGSRYLQHGNTMLILILGALQSDRPSTVL